MWLNSYNPSMEVPSLNQLQVTIPLEYINHNFANVTLCNVTHLYIFLNQARSAGCGHVPGLLKLFS